MDDQSAVIERIKELISYLDISDRKFSSRLEVPPSTIASLFSRNGTPKFDLLHAIAIKFDFISLEWLILGTGPMLKSDKQEQPTTGSDDKKLSFLVEELMELKTKNQNLEKLLQNKERILGLFEEMNGKQSQIINLILPEIDGVEIESVKEGVQKLAMINNSYKKELLILNPSNKTI